MSTSEELLAKRYGAKKPSNPVRNRVLSIIGVTGLVAMAGYFALANYSPVTSTDVGFRVLSEWRTEVDFELSKPVDAVVLCSFEALDNSFGVVGWAEYEFGPSDSTTNRYTINLNTYSMAVTGLVDECRLR
jgi:hypothetical protein